MDNPQQNQKASKVLAKANTWLDCRQAAQSAPKDEKPRAAGRYEVAGRELAEAVVELRSVQP